MRDLFLRACRGDPTETVPVWFMRQAGRSLPEYRAVRERHSILEVCRTPELAVEVTLQPVRRLGVDAAILFSDIVVPLQAMGVDLEIAPGVGPVIDDPVRSAADVDRLRPLDPEEGVPFVLAAVSALTEELDVPLIGFAGAPFTLASYLVEGGPSRDHARTKALMASDPATWHKLMDRLAESVLAYLRAQVAAGAAAIQLFDSWAGALTPNDYRAHVSPAVTRILDGLADTGVPRIHFGVGTGELLELMHATGTDVMGVDWRVPLRRARARLGHGVVLQGNLDPALCLAPFHVVREKAAEVLEETGGARHVFNLGHGVLPDTDPDTLAQLVDFVHTWRSE
ncbi:MAG TPA: uroporphyrinogen decarboxylase [Actinomycetota bacterium]|nr:uroporphyrinogen decarboxylase [Actinomycetota bacterium]